MIVFGDHVCQWVATRTGGEYFGGGQGIGWEKDGELIAGVLFDNFTGRSIQMHVAARPGKRWMTREFLGVCFDYPFTQLKVSKVIGLVDSTNVDAMRFDLHLGFVQEATISDAGKYGDIHVLTMTRQQCRFVKD